MNLFALISLLYLGSISSDIEKQNIVINNKIENLEEQIKINELEFSLHNNYEYLKNLQNIYLDNNTNTFKNSRVNFSEIEEKELSNIYNVATN